MQLSEVEALFNERFGVDGWDVNAYNSPAERQINKPILPTTSATNRMGHARNWPEKDVPLVEAIFYSIDGNDHRLVFTGVEDAISWLFNQDPKTGGVVV